MLTARSEYVALFMDAELNVLRAPLCYIYAQTFVVFARHRGTALFLPDDPSRVSFTVQFDVILYDFVIKHGMNIMVIKYEY